jgi:hypothetical protein
MFLAMLRVLRLFASDDNTTKKDKRGGKAAVFEIGQLRRLGGKYRAFGATGHSSELILATMWLFGFGLYL